jgi:hypothetical protein
VSAWLSEGVSARVVWGHSDPVVHLVVTSYDQLWCSGGRARVAVVSHTNLVGKPIRTCSRCQKLATEAFNEGVADRSELGRFAPDQPATEQED